MATCVDKFEGSTLETLRRYQTPPQRLYVRYNGLERDLKDFEGEEFEIESFSDNGMRDVYSLCFKNGWKEVQFERSVISYGSEIAIWIDKRCAESVLRGSDVFFPGILKVSRNFKREDIVWVGMQNQERDRSSADFLAIGKCEVSITSSQFRNRSGLALKILGISVNNSRENEINESYSDVIELFEPFPSLRSVFQENVFNHIELRSLGSLIATHVAFNTITSTSNCSHVEVLELCAAPGNKTKHLCDLVSFHETTKSISTLKLFAVDVSRKRLERLMKNCKQYVNSLKDEKKNIEVLPVLADGCNLNRTQARRKINNLSEKKLKSREDSFIRTKLNHLLRLERRILSEMHWRNELVQENYQSKCNRLKILKDILMKEHYSKSSLKYKQTDHKVEEHQRLFEQNLLILRNKSFDFVLVDAPCSCSGLRPRLCSDEFFKELNEHKLNFYVNLQRKLLQTAIARSKPGGFIIYSTCSVLQQENEEQVQWLIENSSFKLVEQSPNLFRSCTVGTQRLDEKNHSGSGFFIAKLQKLS